MISSQSSNPEYLVYFVKDILDLRYLQFLLRDMRKKYIPDVSFENIQNYMRLYNRCLQDL